MARPDVPSRLLRPLLPLLLAVSMAQAQEPASRPAVLARHGMVATSQPLAVEAGVAVLREGGSAIDAAIAANACLGLMEPTGCGVGGDLFALVWDNERQELVGLNGSGRSPRGLDLDGLRARLAVLGADEIPIRSALAVSVPGCVDGWFALHARFGRLPMERLLAPAIAYAREGFPVSRVIAGYWRRAETAYAEHPSFGDTFLPGGHAPREGGIFRNPALADTYESLAERGRDAFYTGPIAEAVVRCVQGAGGALALEDLATHRSEWVTPIGVSYRGHELWELPPNGQGLAALQMLRLLEPHDLAGLGFGSAEALHLFVEAKKLAYEDRARFYADPAFADVPVEALLADAYTAQRAALVDPRAASRQPAAGDPLAAVAEAEARLQDGDTVMLVAADDRGNLVAWIQSNYTGFGTGLVPEGTGFCLQSRGNLFHLDPQHPNAYAPGKRPFHTIIPALLTRAGRPVLAFGVMGGAVQPQGHVQIVTNILDFGMDVQAAGDAPRWRHDGSSEPTGEAAIAGGGVVQLEAGLAGTAAALRALGHRIGDGSGDYGGYQGIWVDALEDPSRRVYRGGSESRKDGCAAGY